MKLGKNDKSMEVETVSTGSLGLDIALGVGGLPRGRVVEIYGPGVLRARPRSAPAYCCGSPEEGRHLRLRRRRNMRSIRSMRASSASMSMSC